MSYCTCNMCIDGAPPRNEHPVRRWERSLEQIELLFDMRNMMQCRMCAKHGKKATCPPNVPGISFYQEALKSYTMASIIGRKYPYSDGYFQQHWRLYSTNEIHDLLLKRERELFSEGHFYAKAFIGGSCKICDSDSCGHLERCAQPHRGRVPVEATGVNVFKLIASIDEHYQEPPREYFWRIGMVFY